MKVLFDNNVPAPLRSHLDLHEVLTAREMGWHQLENGALLAAAERDGFAVMVTADQNLAYQQNLKGRSLALVVLNTNNWGAIRLAPERVARAVNAAESGSFQVVIFDRLQGDA